MTEDTNAGRAPVTNHVAVKHRVAVSTGNDILCISFRDGNLNEMRSIYIPAKFARVICDAIEEVVTYCPYCNAFSCDMANCESSSCGMKEDCSEVEHPSMLEKTFVTTMSWDRETTDRTFYVSPLGHHVEEDDLRNFSENSLIRKGMKDGTILVVDDKPKLDVDDLMKQIESMGG